MERNYNAFVVRIWQEEGSAADCTWRGSVQHVRSGETRYFQDLDRLLTFMEKQTGHLLLPPAPLPRK